MSEYFVVRRGATALRNETVWDERISFGALGILARAMATRPGAHLGYRAFTGRGMGEKAVRAALRELEEAGYRHRFTIRASGGRLRTVTVFSDVPISREDALADVEAEDRARMVGADTPAVRAVEGSPEDVCGGVERGADGRPRGGTDESYPQDHSPGTHRAAASAARWVNPQNHGESPDSTVPRSTVARSTGARSTVPRSTGARSSAALSLRDTKPSSSLRSEEGSSDQTEPDEEPRARSARVRGPVGAGPVRSGDEPEREAPASPSMAARRSGRSTSPPDTGRLGRLLGECLPDERMRVLDAEGARTVGALLEERLAAGWTPSQIRQAMDQDLPPRVGRMSSLVASRLRRNVDPSLAPSVLGGADAAARARADEDARWEARRRRSEALAGGAGQRPSGGEEDLMVRAMARVRSESPGVGRAEQARLAAELVRSWQVEGVAS